MPIGPSLPPHLAHLVAGDSGSGSSRSPSASPPPSGPAPASNNVEDDEDDDDYGPALPPHLVAARGKSSSSSTSANGNAGIGPVAPPAAVAGPSRPTAGPAVGPYIPSFEDDSDDDDIGPRPVPSAGPGAESRSAVEEFKEREERRRKEIEEQNKPKVLKREEWMLVPPTSGVLSNVDPLRKRPTTFSRSTADTSAAATDSTIWTETPAEKQQRIADDVAGIKRKKDKAGERVMGFEEEVEERRKRRREEDIRQGVQKHTEAQRGPSLLKEHASKLSKKKDEDDAPAIWDHGRDMGITGRLLTDQERHAKIKEAKGLGDRFGHGKAGAYSM